MTTTAAHADIQPRIVRTLMGAQVLGGVGMAAGMAVGALLAEDISGRRGSPVSSSIGWATTQLGWVSAAIALFIVVLAVTGLRSRKARASADSVWPELDADARADRLAGFRNGVFPGALM